MAGVFIERIRQETGALRVVRAMSSSAADIGLAYSPWCASGAVSEQDRDWVRGLFGACGLTDEVPSGDQIDLFTSLTGPVPGFVAYYANCMIDYAGTTAAGLESVKTSPLATSIDQGLDAAYHKAQSIG